MIPLTWFLIVAAGLFCIGLFGMLARKNAIGVFMGIELMLNSVMINLLAFWRYRDPTQVNGPAFVVIVFATAAAEIAVGLALVISAYRRNNTVVTDDISEMKG